MKIIDAHMHYYDIDKFYEVAENAGHENTAACWQQICQENNIVFGGRLGEYKYYDMDEVIASALSVAEAEFQ